MSLHTPTQARGAETFSDIKVSDQRLQCCTGVCLQGRVRACSRAGMRGTLAGPGVVHQAVSGVAGAVDQASGHLTLLGAASVVLVAVALAGAPPCWTQTG